MAKLDTKDLVELSESQKSFALAANAIKSAIKSACDTAAEAEQVILLLQRVNQDVA